ncbi:MAG: ASPIC/UnbV domain-containing protein [Fuerstiella sp.]
MSQPLDRTCKIEPLGKIDSAAGEFWTHPFAMPQQRDNLSAFETNRLFLNVDGTRFLDASFASQASIDSDSRSVMVGDFDGDLAPDLLVGSVGGGPLRLFLNQFPEGNHRVELRLRGVASNHRAIGARAIAEANGKTIVRDLFAPNGFMGQGPARLNIAVGTADRIDKLTIRWPTGKRQVFEDLPVDCAIKIVEGAEEFELLAPVTSE